jgi:hypothetical protein
MSGKVDRTFQCRVILRIDLRTVKHLSTVQRQVFSDLSGQRFSVSNIGKMVLFDELQTQMPWNRKKSPWPVTFPFAQSP